MDHAKAQTILDTVVANVQKVICGKEQSVRQALTCWLAGGHVLFEDVPGTGKTMLARAIALSTTTETKRIQFTPDLLPSDIIGTSVFARDKGTFVFMRGPLFTGVLLADEINRATPRTQSALLEAMGEGQCTAENQTLKLPPHFFVIATQNPIEQQGTFPLPEAQLDRFMMCLSLGYPSNDVEKSIIRAQLLQHPIDSISPVVTVEEWQNVRNLARTVSVSDSAIQYAMQLVEQTRRHRDVALGGSPRATIALIRCAQAYSLMFGHSFVQPDFIKQLAPAVLEHRLSLTTKARLEKISPTAIVKDILIRTAVPTR